MFTLEKILLIIGPIIYIIVIPNLKLTTLEFFQNLSGHHFHYPNFFRVTHDLSLSRTISPTYLIYLTSPWSYNINNFSFNLIPILVVSLLFFWSTFDPKSTKKQWSLSHANPLKIRKHTSTAPSKNDGQPMSSLPVFTEKWSMKRWKKEGWGEDDDNRTERRINKSRKMETRGVFRTYILRNFLALFWEKMKFELTFGRHALVIHPRKISEINKIYKNCKREYKKRHRDYWFQCEISRKWQIHI